MICLQSMSYSDWTDRVVASSFAGDVSMTSFDSSYHVFSPHDHKNFLPSTNRHKVHKVCMFMVCYDLSLSPSLPPSFQFVCYCYTKPLEESSSEQGGEQQASDSSALAAASAAAVSQFSPSTMKEKARTHRLVFSRQHHSVPQSRAGSFQPDAIPLAAFTKVWLWYNTFITTPGYLGYTRYIIIKRHPTFV